MDNIRKFCAGIALAHLVALIILGAVAVKVSVLGGGPDINVANAIPSIVYMFAVAAVCGIVSVIP